MFLLYIAVAFLDVLGRVESGLHLKHAPQYASFRLLEADCLLLLVMLHRTESNVFQGSPMSSFPINCRGTRLKHDVKLQAVEPGVEVTSLLDACELAGFSLSQYKKYLVETTPEWLLQFQSTHSTA